MKVMVLSNYAEGLWLFRRELMAELSKRYNLAICAPTGERAADLERLGAQWIDCPLLDRHGTNPSQELRLLQFYRGMLRREDPDIVLTYTIKPNVWGGLACQALGVPYIANVTGLGTSVQDGGLMRKVALGLYGIGLRGASMIFFQNAANRDFMLSRGIVRGPQELLPGSGVSTMAFAATEYPSERGGVTLITVGRIMRDKGICELIEAACDVRPRYPNVRFILIGPFDEGVEDLVMHARSNGIIEYVPSQDDVRPYYATCHALVHPSWHEGMSNVCLEAAASARPVIASNIPGCRETFDEGTSGFGFEPKNAESLVEAIERFIALPWEDKRAMGLAGREKVVREFDRQIVVDKYLEAIDRIAKS